MEGDTAKEFTVVPGDPKVAQVFVDLVQRTVEHLVVVEKMRHHSVDLLHIGHCGLLNCERWNVCHRSRRPWHGIEPSARESGACTTISPGRPRTTTVNWPVGAPGSSRTRYGTPGTA